MLHRSVSCYAIRQLLLVVLGLPFGDCVALQRWPRGAQVPRMPLLASTGRFQKPFNVCTSDWAPFVTCTGMDDQSKYTGYQVEVWREIAKDLGWNDTDWTFSCIDWTPMLDDLVDPNGRCSFAAAGMTITLPRIAAGIKYSWPIYKSGFQVLIASQIQSGGVWAFAEAFHWSVWLVLGLTAIFVSLLVTALERLSYHSSDKPYTNNMRQWAWYSMSKLVVVPSHVNDPKTWASRVCVLGYGLLVMIMVHLFTATTASKMTEQRLASDITGLSDLPGRKVLTAAQYVADLRKYSIDSTSAPWENDADIAAMLNGIRSNKFSALVLDAPAVQYHASHAPTCDLHTVGDLFETSDLAIGFPPTTPDNLIANISASIIRLQVTTALLDQLENVFISSTDASTTSDKAPTCTDVFKDLSSGSNDIMIIRMEQVAGLWYILAITLFCSLVITAVDVARYKHNTCTQTSAMMGAEPSQKGQDGGQDPMMSSAHVAGTPAWDGDGVAKLAVAGGSTWKQHGKAIPESMNGAHSHPRNGASLSQQATRVPARHKAGLASLPSASSRVPGTVLSDPDDEKAYLAAQHD